MSDNTSRDNSTSSLDSDSGRSQERRVGGYVILNKIGQGSFATVYKAQHKACHDNAPFAKTKWQSCRMTAFRLSYCLNALDYAADRCNKVGTAVEAHKKVIGEPGVGNKYSKGHSA